MSRRRSLQSKASSSSSSSVYKDALDWPLSDVAGDGTEEEKEEERGGGGDGNWAEMLPELMTDIVWRLESGSDRWPARRDVVACACVCRQWREIATDVVRPSAEIGTITFPSSLKAAGPKDFPMQCIIKWDRKSSTFSLFLGLNQSLMDNGKFLLAAQRYRHGACTEYIISLDSNDFSQGSKAYLGKLRSDFLGTKFRIYDSQAPYDGAKASNTRASRRFANKQISPQVPAGNFEIGQVAYKFNLLKSRGPRRMHCSLQFPSAHDTSDGHSLNQKNHKSGSCLTLRNKTPQWHENLQCWCLNFQGRVTVASVKNFQLVATSDSSQPLGIGNNDTVLLQFGKVGDDIFTMDYRHPLSAFQAFAICLTSFGTKFACE